MLLIYGIGSSRILIHDVVPIVCMFIIGLKYPFGAIDAFSFMISTLVNTITELPGSWAGPYAHVNDVLRKIPVLATWSHSVYRITAWLIEPAVASVCVKGDSINVLEAKERFYKDKNNQIRGMWAGWPTSKECERVGGQGKLMRERQFQHLRAIHRVFDLPRRVKGDPA